MACIAVDKNRWGVYDYLCNEVKLAKKLKKKRQYVCFENRTKLTWKVNAEADGRYIQLQ